MKVFMNKNGYTIFRCAFCGLERTDLKKPYGSFVKEYYTREFFTGDPIKSAFSNYKDDKRFILMNMKQFLSKVRKYKKTGRLLDVGCACGFFVELARQQGFDAWGFDPSSYAVQEARRLVGESKITEGTISSVAYPEKSFDVITLFDVFEHLDDPGEDIKKLSKFLKDDGIIVIATGDTESVMAKVLRQRWTFYIPPQHLFFFNKKTLTALLRTYDLVPVEWFRIGKWLSLRYVLHLARTAGESVLAQSLYEWISALRMDRVPVYLPVRDNMVTVIKKSITE